MAKPRKTVGTEAVARLSNPDTKQGIVDTEREINKDYFEQIEICIKRYPDWRKPYYVIVHTKKEKLLQNVIRRSFFGRQSLPTPQWDQTVWRYYPSSSDLEFLWTLPDENTAMWMADHINEIHPEQHELLQFVLDCLDKKLYKFYEKKFKSKKD